MLSPAERDIAARDVGVPGLPLLLDTDRLVERLGPAMGSGRPHNPYLRYKPGTSCGLALHLEGGAHAALAATAYTREHYATVRARPKWREKLDQVTFLDDACMVVTPMTLDRKLRALAALSDEGRRASLLGHVAGPALPAAPRITLLRYNPSRRAVLRLDGPGGPVALAKVHAEEEWPRALDGARLAEALGGVRLLGAREKARLLLFEWVDGQPLWSAEGALGEDAALQATGATLARLHRSELRVDRCTGMAEEADELAAAASAIGVLLPALGERAAALAHAVGAALGAHERRPSLVHGDFSADQVVLGPSGPVLIDWDRAALGDPARDLASFLARLDLQAIDGDLSVSDVARARRALLAGYAGETSLPPGVAAQRARALLALAPEGFRQRRPNWPERVRAVLDSVEALLPPPHRAGRDPVPTTLWARNPEVAGPLVAAALEGARGTVTEVELLRQKPGRRALIRYLVEDGVEATAVLGKLRAKGLDRRTPALHAALRAAGLDGTGPYRVGVPRALGLVDDLHLWLQEEVPGRRITDYLPPGQEPKAAFRAGVALARLHACGVEPSRPWTLADELEVLARSLDEAAESLPSEAVRLRALASSSAVLGALLGSGPEVGIHRDWHPDQALLHGDAVWILDLDLHARGDPAIDLGNFVAHVTELSIRRHGDPGVLAGHERAFVEGYAAAGGTIDADRVAVLKALSLARLAAISQRIPDRRPATPDILAAAERLVAEAVKVIRRPVQV